MQRMERPNSVQGALRWLNAVAVTKASRRNQVQILAHIEKCEQAVELLRLSVNELKETVVRLEIENDRLKHELREERI